MSEEVMVSEFATPMTGQQIEKEKIRISKLKKYFQRCQECDKLKPVGWMHDSKICQGCAQKKHGVVY
jgi:rRNA maturation endonuclease Nob1